MSGPVPAGALEEAVRLIELSPAPAALVSVPEGVVQAANGPMLVLLGLAAEEVPGAQFPHALMHDPMARPRGPVPGSFQRDDGTTVEVLTTCRPIASGGGRNALVVAMERPALAGAMPSGAAGDEALTLLPALSFDAVGVVDMEGTILHASASSEAVTGYSPRELEGSNLSSLLHPEDWPAALESMGRAFASPGRVESGTFRFRHKSGEWRYCETAGMPVQDGPAGEVLVIHYRDVTESIVNRAALEALTERFARIFEFSPLPTALIRNRDRVFIEVNAAFLAFSGYTREEVVGRLATHVFWPSEEERLAMGQALRAEGQVRGFPLRFRTRSGREIETLNYAETMVVGGEPCLLGTAIDITERKALEQRLQQVEKLDAIARLAAGVAHDFNNVLGVIKLEASVLGRNGSLDAAAQEALAEIHSATDRAAGMTRQLLMFGRNEAFAPATVRLRESVEGLSSILRPLLGRGVTVALDLAEGLWDIRADRGQLDQVLINLAVNARDAMAGRGVVTIGARNETVDDESSSPGPGDYVAITVSDTGTGMDELTRVRIFEPFFTTKPPGKGTGLGLAAVHGIVIQHGGAITVNSEAGAGTSFTIFWPRAE